MVVAAGLLVDTFALSLAKKPPHHLLGWVRVLYHSNVCLFFQLSLKMSGMTINTTTITAITIPVMPPAERPPDSVSLPTMVHAACYECTNNTGYLHSTASTDPDSQMPNPIGLLKVHCSRLPAELLQDISFTQSGFKWFCRICMELNIIIYNKFS